jgi:peroxiredoxin Q/BCP
MLEVGQTVPQFTAVLDGGSQIDSASLAGRPYVVYFYPRDNTPGCTQEACDFRDRFERIAAAGATVLGVSRDSVKSHDGFKAKHSLPFHLVSDADLALHNTFGAWGSKTMYGKVTEGTIRSTFLVDSAGVVRFVWPKVSVKGHVDAVVAALEGLAP